MVVPVGQDEVKLQCHVKNAQDYTWYKNGAQFSAPLPPRYTIKAYRFLEITNAVKSDSGLFFCVTSNNVGSANCSVELLVEGMDISLLYSIIVPCIALYWSTYTCPIPFLARARNGNSKRHLQVAILVRQRKSRYYYPLIVGACKQFSTTPVEQGWAVVMIMQV